MFAGNPLPLIVIKAPPELDPIDGLIELITIFYDFGVTLLSIFTNPKGYMCIFGILSPASKISYPSNNSN